MKIKWNEVTWYSRWAAIILLIGVLPAWTFYLGTRYEEVVIILLQQGDQGTYHVASKTVLHQQSR